MAGPIVFFRGGALGDFLLTLPLLEVARRYGTQIKLHGRVEYFCLLDQNWDWLQKADIDESIHLFSNLPPSSRVVTFWKDLDWQKQAKRAGASSTFSLNPRPESGAHFFQQAIESLGWDRASGWDKKSYLGNYWRGGDQLLWIHPGSGGAGKNLPLSYYENVAKQWIGSRDDRKVVFSFGEADQKLFKNFQNSELLKFSRMEVFHSFSLQGLRDEMIRHADQFMGNDSGPGHLAANLGIPVRIGFRGTNQSVWRPTGPHVITYNWVSDSKRIL
jgi:ADP-heptose:LPS heptosyltransferase